MRPTLCRHFVAVKHQDETEPVRMIAAQRRLLLAAALACPVLGAPVFAQEHGRMRLEGGLHPGPSSDIRSLFSTPLPPGPALTAEPMPRAVNAYAPEQHVRLKQMNFTGAQ